MKIIDFIKKIFKPKDDFIKKIDEIEKVLDDTWDETQAEITKILYPKNKT